MLEAEFKEQTALAMRRIETWPLSIRKSFRVSDPKGIPYRPDPALRGPGIWIIECDAGCQSLWYDSEEAATPALMLSQAECDGEHAVAEFVRAEPKRKS